MKTLRLLFFLILFCSADTVFSGYSCSPSSCGPIGLDSPQVRFPFWLKNRQDTHCGYQGFDLYCNDQNRTILKLPPAGEFLVQRIEYRDRMIYINDPDFCLPNRMLNFTLPHHCCFKAAYLRNFTFLNCTEWSRDEDYKPVPVCRPSNIKYNNYTVVARDGSNFGVPSPCRNISTVGIPVQKSMLRLTDRMDFLQDLQLEWKDIGCGGCEAGGEPAGLPRSAKYGIIIGVGIPGIVCLVGLASFVGGRIKIYRLRRRPDHELANPVITSQPAMAMTGLDRPTIESYPLIVFGQSEQLPRPNDSICPICLSDYQSKETLRSIPECGHYFHATCIDEWLGLNATCPICRKSPDESSVVTPCVSTSSSSSATMATH
ncbi:hypothetical protein NMG60_11026950 [Bertholletia excelsa]